MSSLADKQRAYRQRRNGGRVVFRIEADEAELELMLQDAGFLLPAEANHRHAVEGALARFIEAAIADHLAARP